MPNTCDMGAQPLPLVSVLADVGIFPQEREVIRIIDSMGGIPPCPAADVLRSPLKRRVHVREEQLAIQDAVGVLGALSRSLDAGEPHAERHQPLLDGPTLLGCGWSSGAPK